MSKYIVTNLKCHGEGEKSIVYYLFGKLCKSHKALAEMAKKQKIPVSDKKTMAEALQVPYRDLSWLIRHSKSSSGYDYPHIKLGIFPGSRLDPKITTVEERIFSRFFFMYFIDKISQCIDDDNVDLEKLDFTDLCGDIMEMDKDDKKLLVRESRNNIEVSVTKIMRSLGYGELSSQVAEKVYPCIYTFAKKMGIYGPDEMTPPEELMVTRSLKKFSTYPRISDVFFQAPEYRSSLICPFKIPLYTSLKKLGLGNEVAPFTLRLALNKKIKFYYRTPTGREEVFEQKFPIETKTGWSFKYSAFFKPYITTRDHEHELTILPKWDRVTDTVVGDKFYIIPGLWYVLYNDDFFYLSHNTGYLNDCEDEQLKCMNHEDFVRYSSNIHSSNRIIFPKDDGSYILTPMFVGFEDKCFMIFPTDRRNLPRDIFADKERVLECLEKFVS